MHAVWFGLLLACVCVDGWVGAVLLGLWEMNSGGAGARAAVLFFAALGLVFDVISFCSYVFWASDHDGYRPVDAGDDDKGGVVVAKPAGRINVNMLSALMHVGSDFLRSLTTLVEGLVIMYAAHVNSVRADGVSALVVCTIILLGTVAAFFVWLRELHEDLHLQVPKTVRKLAKLGKYDAVPQEDADDEPEFV